MSLFTDLQEYLDHARRCETSAALRSDTADFVRVLGFDFFALLHHVDFDTPPLRAIRLGNYPPVWREILLERQYFGDDPILVACQSTVSGFEWREIERLIALTPRQREILGASAEAGVGAGFTVPIHLPGDFEASCSFGLMGARPMPERTLPAAQYVACFAFEQARRLNSAEQAPKAPKLTQRQLDCLILAARGKSAGVAGTLLGISGETVHEHLAEAKRRYGVATVQQLTVRALHDSQIAFADLF